MSSVIVSFDHDQDIAVNDCTPHRLVRSVFLLYLVVSSSFLLACNSGGRTSESFVDLGTLPLLRVPVSSQAVDDSIISEMRRLGGKLSRYSKDTIAAPSPLFSPAVTGVGILEQIEFAQGNVGGVDVEGIRVAIWNHRVTVVRWNVIVNSFAMEEVRAIYDKVKNHIERQIGPPMELAADEDMDFVFDNVHMREQLYGLRGGRFGRIQFGEPTYNKGGGVIGARCWNIEQQDIDWAVLLFIDADTAWNSNREWALHYDVGLILSADPTVNIARIDTELAKRERSYSGWILFGPHTQHDFQFLPCESVTPEDYRSVTEANAENGILLYHLRDTPKWRLLGTSKDWTYGQLDYWLDTSSIESRWKSLEMKSIFVQCLGIMFSNDGEGSKDTMFYITKMNSIRRANEAMCRDYDTAKYYE